MRGIPDFLLFHAQTLRKTLESLDLSPYFPGLLSNPPRPTPPPHHLGNLEGRGTSQTAKVELVYIKQVLGKEWVGAHRLGFLWIPSWPRRRVAI
jgi:hypothetical protein